jgi:hypothetical protein
MHAKSLSTGRKRSKEQALPILVVTATVFLLGVNHAIALQQQAQKPLPVLAACTKYWDDEYFKDKPVDIKKQEPFRDIDFSEYDIPAGASPADTNLEIFNVSELTQWKEEFHSTVGAIVAEDMEDQPPKCTATTYEETMQPRPQLSALAQKLPSWENREGNNFNISRLSQLDVGTVLLEYLQMYECALVERSLFLPLHSSTQESNRATRLREILDSASVSTDMPAFLKNTIQGLRTLFHLTAVVIADRGAINAELFAARSSVHRALSFIGGYNRLRPIETELKCLQQATLDIRNGFALAADAGSCLPRIWNAKDSQRDPE